MRARHRIAEEINSGGLKDGRLAVVNDDFVATDF